MFLVRFLKKLLVAQQMTYYLDDEKTEIVLQRFYLLFKENKWFNLCIHKLPPTPNYPTWRVLHNHPWFNISVILKGGYWEYTTDKNKWRIPGSVIFRKSSVFHNTWVNKQTCWTMFIKLWVVQEQSFLIDGVVYKHSELKMLPVDFV